MEEALQWNKDAILNLNATAVQPNMDSEDMRIRTRPRQLAAEVVHRELVPREGGQGGHDGRQIYLTKGISRALRALGILMGARDAAA